MRKFCLQTQKKVKNSARVKLRAAPAAGIYTRTRTPYTILQDTQPVAGPTPGVCHPGGFSTLLLTPPGRVRHNVTPPSSCYACLEQSTTENAAPTATHHLHHFRNAAPLQCHPDPPNPTTTGNHRGGSAKRRKTNARPLRCLCPPTTDERPGGNGSNAAPSDPSGGRHPRKGPLNSFASLL